MAARTGAHEIAFAGVIGDCAVGTRRQQLSAGKCTQIGTAAAGRENEKTLIVCCSERGGGDRCRPCGVDSTRD